MDLSENTFVGFRSENLFANDLPQKEIHIRLIVQGRRSSTILENLNLLIPTELKTPEEVKKFEKKLLSSFNKEFHCSGGISDDKNVGRIVKLTGDQRANLKDFLIRNSIVRDDELKIHGV